MWCKNCRQDVPAVSGAADEKPCCIRCGSVILAARSVEDGAPALRIPALRTTTRRSQPAHAPTVGSGSTVAIRAPLSAFDTWEVAEQLQHVDRILSGARFTTEVRHPPAAEPPAPSSAMRSKLGRLGGQSRARSRRRVHLAWAIVAVGAAALGCGILLLATGTLIGRPRWQSIGLPVTLLGQVALLLGMMLHLDLVWKGKRETASKLYQFQKRLVDLEALASEFALVAGEEPPPPPGERELMVELKARLDVLSHRLNLPSG